MGTNAHSPHSGKTSFHGAHDDAGRAKGPGERPGVPSRIEAVRARLRRNTPP